MSSLEPSEDTTCQLKVDVEARCPHRSDNEVHACSDISQGELALLELPDYFDLLGFVAGIQGIAVVVLFGVGEVLVLLSMSLLEVVEVP